MALRQEAEDRLCNLGRFGPVVLPLGRVALDFGGGRLRFLVERGAGLRLLQRCVTIPGRQELFHALFQELHVHLVTALLQRELRKSIRLHYHVIAHSTAQRYKTSNNSSAPNAVTVPVEATTQVKWHLKHFFNALANFETLRSFAFIPRLLSD